MLPFPLLVPPRIGAAALPLALELRLARRGGRAFALRDQPGDVTIALPEVGGAATVLVPRGFGHPLYGRRNGSELRAEPAGEPCAPARWVPAGGIGAWLRAVPPPRGPTHAVWPEPMGDGAGAWICVRPAALAWSALRLVTPAAGHGPVVVADRWVRAASPAARARGVARGMSVALARRRCPELVAYPTPGGADLSVEIAHRLEGWLGPVTRRRGALYARLSGPAAPGPEALASAERIARLLWQELGVESRIGVAATIDAAHGLSGFLEPGWVGVAPTGASAAWGGRPSRAAQCGVGPRRASWRGAPMPDLEGTVTRAGLLTGTLLRGARGNLLRVTLRGARGAADVRVRVPARCGRLGLARLVEGVVRREGAAVGAIEAVTLRIVRVRAEKQAIAPSLAAPAPRLSRKTWFRAPAPAGGAAPGPQAAAPKASRAGSPGAGATASRAASRPAQLALLPRVR